VGDVHVTAVDDGLVLLEVCAVEHDGLVPLLAEGDAGEVVLGVGRVGGDDVELVELGCDDPALVVAVAVVVADEATGFDKLLRDVVDDGEWLYLGKYCSTAVAFARARRIPVLCVLWEVDFGLSLLCLGLLETHDIWLVLCDELLNLALAHDCSYAIYIPAVYLHAYKYTIRC
jgi:hypothetical protein